MNILITGASGFIGRHLVERLTECRKHSLFCLVRNSNKAKNIKKFGVELIYADITRNDTLSQVLNYKIDVIFHCAGCVDSRKHSSFYCVNVLGTENICLLALRLGVERVVYLSSVAVVSGNSQIPLTEDLPFRATSIYGESKIEGEKKVCEYRKKGLRAVILRPCMVYGKGASHMAGRILFGLKHRILPLVDNGKRKLHMIFVKNVVEAMIFSLSKKEFLKGSFFIADKEVFTAYELFNVFSKALNVGPPLNIPGFLNRFLLGLPFIGRKLKFFNEDRVYSTKRIELWGFYSTYSLKDNFLSFW